MSNKSAVIGGLLLLLAGVALGWFGAGAGGPVGGSHEGHAEEHGHEDAHEDEDEHGHGEESMTRITAQAAAAAGIQTAFAGPGEIADQVLLQGTVTLAEDQVYAVSARYGGVVETVAVAVGDAVKKGDLLARVQNTDSLRSYQVVAPADGLVLARHASAGAAADGTLFTVADLATVWVDFSAFPKVREKLQTGQPVAIAGLDGEPRVESQLSLIAPVGDPANQAILVRAVVPNPDRSWVPGALVTGRVTVDVQQVPLVVQANAVQLLDGQPVVFAREGDRYEARRLTLGARDAQQVAVLDGLAPGTEYVTANSYLIKADLLKAGAAHAH